MSSVPRQPFPLWSERAPGALGDSPENDVPTLAPYWPKGEAAAPRASVIVCPGGSYGMLAEYEGRDYALWLNDQGVAAFVLKYRLGTNGYRHPAMADDLGRAIRTVRHHAKAWNLDPGKIGAMGSSAGGHLVATLMTHFDGGQPAAADAVDRASSRPDFGVLCYAVVSMGALAHEESKKNLLGPLPARELVRLLSNELHVTPQTPPCFIWHTQDDAAVKVENVLVFAAALQANGVSFSLHIYPSGPHGLGLGRTDYQPGDMRPLHAWTWEFRAWLAERKFTA